MAGEEEKERMKQLLMEAVCTLCRSGMKFDMAMRVEGLLAITVDEKDVVVVNINKSFKLPGNKLAEVSPEDKEQQERTSENEQHHRKKRKSRDRNEGCKRSASESSAEENDGKVVKIEEAESDNDNQSQMPWMLGDASANPASGQESNMDIMQADKAHSQGTSTHNSQSQSSQVQGQIKIEIDSDSDDDISVLESWDSVVQGQRDLVPMQPGSATVPVSMFRLSDGSQQLPGCSQDLAQLSANASQFPQPFTSMDSQQQGVVDFSTAELLEHSKGKECIALGGYRYGKRRQGSGNTVHWRCTQHAQYACRAKLVTKATKNGTNIIYSLFVHNHSPPKVTNEQLKYRRLCFTNH